MPDTVNCVATSQLLHTGKGVLHGLVVSNNHSGVILLTLYDSTAASGTSIFRAYISQASVEQPFTVFFPDRYAPRFDTGLYIGFSADGVAIACVWRSNP
jgi:hypothetical protein